MSTSNIQTCSVYIITFPNGKFYIGCTQDLETRITSHRSPSSGTCLSDEFEKHGKDNFEVSVVCENFPKQMALSIEAKIIRALYDNSDCLNQMNPLGISTKVNKKISETQKRRIRKRKLAEHRKKK